MDESLKNRRPSFVCTLQNSSTELGSNFNNSSNLNPQPHMGGCMASGTVVNRALIFFGRSPN